MMELKKGFVALCIAVGIILASFVLIVGVPSTYKVRLQTDLIFDTNNAGNYVHVAIGTDYQAVQNVADALQLAFRQQYPNDVISANQMATVRVPFGNTPWLITITVPIEKLSDILIIHAGPFHYNNETVTVNSTLMGYFVQVTRTYNVVDYDISQIAVYSAITIVVTVLLVYSYKRISAEAEK